MTLETLIPYAVPAILAIIALEAILLRPLLARRGLGYRYPAFLAGLAAGGALALALAAALGEWGWIYLALFLSLSFLAHAIEVGLVMRRDAGKSKTGGGDV